MTAEEIVDHVTYQQYKRYREMGIAAERLFFYSDTDRERLEAKYREEKREAA